MQYVTRSDMCFALAYEILINRRLMKSASLRSLISRCRAREARHPFLYGAYLLHRPADDLSARPVERSVGYLT
jgi:hypothetical protein